MTGGPTVTAPDRRVPAWATALLLGLSAAVLVLVALLAGRAGPLVAHPPTAAPAPPPTRSLPAITLPTMPSFAAPPPQHQPSGAWLWWVAGVIAALILVFLVLALVRALRRPARIAAPAMAAPGSPIAPVALGWLDEESAVDLGDDRTFDPRRAADDIIASWTAVESAATRRGVARRPSSTPTEFLDEATARLGDGAAGDRAVDDRAGDDRAVGERAFGEAAAPAAQVLLGLYHHARFDTAALAPGAATRARRAARALIGAWEPGDRGDPSTGVPGEDPSSGPSRGTSRGTSGGPGGSSGVPGAGGGR